MRSQAGRGELPERFGPFILQRRLAVGGSAEVYLARPRVGDRPAPQFVIKRLLPALRNEEDYAVLVRESELHRMVSHPNVVDIFGAGMVDREPYLAMEYVDGVDLFRLMRAAEADSRKLPSHVAVHVARCVAEALEAVHVAHGESGSPLGIVHGDVSPSNIYVSRAGDVKLGDFGIARVAERATRRSSQQGGIRGKWEYVAPEVLDGEPVDHRADLFSLAAVLGELLLGERIFPGEGQLAVLLSIRDANIAPLRRAQSTMPPGLFELLETALRREPGRRYQSAQILANALGPFELVGGAHPRELLQEWVAFARDAQQLAERIEGRVKESVHRMLAVESRATGTPPPRVAAPQETVSAVRRASGERLRGLPFAKLIEMIATGELGGEDEVSLIGAPFQRIDEIEELARHLLPSTTMRTGQLFEPGVPDFVDQLESTPMFEILARMRADRETGALFVERHQGEDFERREIYLSRGRLLHVASSDPQELLGEYLVRKGKLERGQLDTALGVLSSYNGRLGDTLVGLGMVDVLDVFRAIRDQGRDRVGRVCAWSCGRVAFYRGTAPGPVQFPLDLDLASTMMAGAILASEGRPAVLLPPPESRVCAGPRADLARDRDERGTAPASLQLVPAYVLTEPRLSDLVQQLMTPAPGGNSRPAGPREAHAAVFVARCLGWLDFVPATPAGT